MCHFAMLIQHSSKTIPISTVIAEFIFEIDSSDCPDPILQTVAFGLLLPAGGPWPSEDLDQYDQGPCGQQHAFQR
jgi:hypothetical protein